MTSVQYCRLDEALPPRVEEAFAEEESLHFQHGLSWYELLASTVLSSESLPLLAVIYEEEQNFACFALEVRTKELLIKSLSTYYSCSYLPIVRSANPSVLLIELFTAIRQDYKGYAIYLEPLAVDEPLTNLTLSAMRSAGWSGVHSFHRFGSLRHKSRGEDWLGYFSTSLPRRLQNTIDRKKRALEKKQFQIVVSKGDDYPLELLVGWYEEVYRGSWKPSEPSSEFIARFFEYLHAREWLLTAYVLDGQHPVATQLWVLQPGAARIFKLAHLKSAAKGSYGTLLLATLMERVLNKEEGVEVVDFMQGEEAYKADWMSEKLEFIGLAGYSSAFARIKHIAKNSARHVRARVSNSFLR